MPGRNYRKLERRTSRSRFAPRPRSAQNACGYRNTPQRMSNAKFDKWQDNVWRIAGSDFQKFKEGSGHFSDKEHRPTRSRRFRQYQR